jgi:hypothetical protein
MRMSREGHCQIQGCTKKIKARRMCQYHYYKHLYPAYSDRPNVFPKKNPKAINEDVWKLIAADIESGKISL